MQKDGVDVLVNGAPVVYLFNLPAFLVSAALAILLVIGVSESAKFNNVIVAIKVTVLVAFILVGGAIILANLPTYMPNWDPFIPPPTGEKGEFGWSGILRAASIVFFAYIGFEAVSTAGQEAKDPAKDMPFGIIGSLVVCTIIYILVSIVMTLIVPYTSLNVPDPVAVAVDAFGPQWAWFAKTIKVGAIIGLTSVILVLMYGQTRIFYTMARDGLLPKFFSRVHPKFRTPWINTLVVGLAVASAAGFFDINFLGDATSVGTLAAFGIVCLTVIWLRRTHPEIPRGYKVPLYPVLPALGIVSCFALIFTVEIAGADLLRLVCRRGDRALLRLRHAQFGAGQGPSGHRRRGDALFPRGCSARRERQAGHPAVATAHVTEGAVLRAALFLCEQVAGQRLQVRFGPGAIMLDHFGRGDRAELERLLEAPAARLAGEEAGGEQVAGAGRVDQPLDRLGGHVGALAAAPARSRHARCG